jgi:phosphoglycolate phosphatase
VLFDLDGTLTDSEPGIVASLVFAFTAAGLPVPDAAVLRETIGPPFEIGLPAIGVPPDRLALVVDHYRDHYEDASLFDSKLFDGVVDMIDELAERELVLLLATAKPEVSARRIVEHFGLADRFTVIAGATYEPGRRTKAEVIGHALDVAGVEPGPHIVMVGDRDHDVLGAHAHGIDAIGVTWGYGIRDELLAAGAMALAETPAELVALIAGRKSPIAGARP